MNGKLFSAGVQLTGTYAYSAIIPHDGNNYIEIDYEYDPDEGASATLNLIVLSSNDSTETSDASSVWVQTGKNSVSGGTNTFTADTYTLVSTGAGTKKQGHLVIQKTGRKFKIGIKETGVISDYGNATVSYNNYEL